MTCESQVKNMNKPRLIEFIQQQTTYIQKRRQEKRKLQRDILEFDASIRSCDTAINTASTSHDEAVEKLNEIKTQPVEMTIHDIEHALNIKNLRIKGDFS